MTAGSVYIFPAFPPPSSLRELHNTHPPTSIILDLRKNIVFRPAFFEILSFLERKHMTKLE